MIAFKISDFLNDDSGATAIEYALIAGIVSIAIVTGLIGVKDQLAETFTKVADSFPDM
jgi:pilus assembly protein Flp/PilA